MENLFTTPKIPEVLGKFVSKDGYFISCIGGRELEVKNIGTSEWHKYTYTEMGLTNRLHTYSWNEVEEAFAIFLGEAERYRKWSNDLSSH